MRTCRVCSLEGDDELFVKNGNGRKNTCKKCDASRVAAYQKTNAEAVRVKNRNWRAENQDAVREQARGRSKKWREANPESVSAARARYRSGDGKLVELAYGAAYRAKNKAAVNAKKLMWMKANPHKVNAVTRRRFAAKKGATPIWANAFFIEEAYELAKLREKVCGGRWHVDHIVPLTSKLVCGLHVEYNLQVIPATVNQSKNNRYWPEMP